jgi:hypothetical protein
MSSFVILDMEAIYGYVSGATRGGAREERDAEKQRRTERHRIGKERREREWTVRRKDRKGRQEGGGLKEREWDGRGEGLSVKGL